MLKSAGIGLATMSDLKNKQKETLEAATRARIYLLNDGQPVAGLVSLSMMELLEEVLEDRALGRVAAERVTAVESGAETLMDEDAFLAAADRAMAAKGSAKAAARLSTKAKR